ncbi:MULTISPECIES: trypsin-like serine peptidase [unclassified Burkholderia]|uniref:trypsin-like serine peptidase n=1 Tax=unclassified Burkholderia TaxID=2613784 RepID=UPI002ABD347F|nr:MULTISPECIES: trypsin-like peptidase domain-containing protein [unclassified Burkholderia]
MNENDSRDDRAAIWRRRLGLQSVAAGGPFEAALESGTGDSTPAERIKHAREEMRRIVIERFGGDAALLESVAKLAITAQDAVAVLEAAEREPALDEYSSLEAIVAFDGTRPSFLLKNGEVDLESSYSTSSWKTMLSSKSEQLAAFAACVGRVEIQEQGIGTAFLVAPTLAVTNRHVAQMIAFLMPDGFELKADIFLDFGREYKGRTSYDRRTVRNVLFAGAERIEEPVNHGKLDFALLEVEPSKLTASDERDRKLAIQAGAGEVARGLVVIAAGYPADWRLYVPTQFQSEHEAVIAKLLEGDNGVKRLAPGESTGMLPAAENATSRTTTHDATTINGNSGSPLAVLSSAGKLGAVGLHYGGQWQGNRTNWAHVLGACAGAKVTGELDLHTALAQHGVIL